MATPQSLERRHQDILDQYATHHALTLDLQRDVLDRLVPDLTDQQDHKDQQATDRANAFARDTSMKLYPLVNNTNTAWAVPVHLRLR